MQLQDEEITSYPTVSALCDSDRKRYVNSQVTKREVTCQICGIKFDSQVYASCPLCEIKKSWLNHRLIVVM